LPRSSSALRYTILSVLCCLLTSIACSLSYFVNGSPVQTAAPTHILQAVSAKPTVVSAVSSKASPTALLTSSPTFLPTASPTAVVYNLPKPPTQFVDPVGCERPPDDYTRVVVNGAKLDYRTLWMLQHAQKLYGGPIDFAGAAITQGSYNPGGVTASFGTHDGGGAVDLAVINLRTGQVMRDQFPTAIHALRVTGFAAWVREPNELYQGSPIHIHAIAVGDAQLSPAAKDQLTGAFRYFLGYNGLPQQNGIPPIRDLYGGPILCQWMLDMGYRRQ